MKCREMHRVAFDLKRKMDQMENPRAKHKLLNDEVKSTSNVLTTVEDIQSDFK